MILFFSYALPRRFHRGNCNTGTACECSHGFTSFPGLFFFYNTA